MILSIAFLIMDKNYHSFQQLRAMLDVSVLPIQYLVDAPIKTIHWLANSVTTQKHLLEENASLRAHELLLESKLQKLLALERENAQLRKLLKSTSHLGGKVIVAQLLAVALDPNLQQVVVNTGMRNHVYVGQPVLDAYGVMGQVIHVGPFTSKVMLITDPKSAIPVQDNRNGVRAIAVGLGGSGKLALTNLSDSSDVKPGDLFVASGLGMRYPVGYPVGIVADIANHSNGYLIKIILQPKAHLDQTQQVLLAWPDGAPLAKALLSH